MDLGGPVLLPRAGDALERGVAALGAELPRHVRSGGEAGVAAADPGAGAPDQEAVRGQHVQAHLLEHILEKGP